MTSQPVDKSISKSPNPVTTPIIHVSPAPFVAVGIVLAIGTAFAVNYASNLPPLLIIGVAIGLFLAISVFQKPEFGAYILIFSVFTNLSDLFTEKGLPSINKPMVALVVLSIFANYILKTGKLSMPSKITGIDFTLGIYLLAVAGSAFVAIDQSKSLATVFDLIKDVVVGYCIYITLDSKEKIKVGLKIFVLAITFTAFLGVLRNITGSNNDFWGFAQLSAFNQVSDSDGQLRYAGPIGESNIWGQVLVSAIPVILYMIISQTNTSKSVVQAAASLIILLAMMFTESRGAFLALVFILGLMALDMRIKSTTFLVFTSAILIVLAILPDKYSQRFKSLDILFQNQEYSYTQDESFNGRRAKMLIGLAMFADNPFLGVGISNYTDNYWVYAGSLGLDSAILSVGTDEETSSQQPHSLYIEIMSETGIFGITSFLAFLGLIIYDLYRSRRYLKKFSNSTNEWSVLTASIMMSLLTFLIAGFFLHGIGFRFIWVLIGIALSFIRFSPNQSLPISAQTAIQQINFTQSPHTQ